VASVGLGVGCAYWAAKSSARVRHLRERHAREIDLLGARVDTVEAILASEPDALLIWSPDTLIAKPGTLQSRPRIAGSTAALADPATGAVDYEQVIRRLAPDAGSALRAAVDRLR